MAAALQDRYEDVEVELFESGGGRFEVTVDERLVFSKRRTGRHPEPEEIFAEIG